MDDNPAFAALLPKVGWMLGGDRVGVLVREPKRIKTGVNRYQEPDFGLREVVEGRRYGEMVGLAELKTTAVRLNNNDNIPKKLKIFDDQHPF